jgi:hypothetical protein
MKAKIFPLLTILLIATMALLSMFWFAGETRASVFAADLPGLRDLEGLHPNSAPIDLALKVLPALAGMGNERTPFCKFAFWERI